MQGVIEARLKELGIKLSEISAPVASYIPYVITGKLVYISGQICKADGKIVYAGKVGKDYTEEQSKAAARLCALNVLATLKSACQGDLDRVKRCVRVGVFVNSTDDFTGQSLTANGASDLFVDVFGENGKHVRAAVSCNSLPGDTAVEVEAVFELKA